MKMNKRTKRKDRRSNKEKLYFSAYYDYRKDAMGNECRPPRPPTVLRSDGKIKPGPRYPRENMMNALKDTPMHPWRIRLGKER